MPDSFTSMFLLEGAVRQSCRNVLFGFAAVCFGLFPGVRPSAAQTIAPSNYNAYTGTDIKAVPPAPPLGPANSVVTDPDFGSRILRVTDANTNGGESFISTDSGFSRTWNADSTAIKLTGPYAAYWLEFNPITFRVGTGSGEPVVHPLSFGTTWEWSAVQPNILYYLSGSTIKSYNTASGVSTPIASTPTGDPVTYMAAVVGLDNWICAAAGSGTQNTYTKIFCVKPSNPAGYKFIDVVKKTINGAAQSTPNWPKSATGATIGIHDISGGTGPNWLEVTFHQQSWGANGGAVFNLSTNIWSLVTNADNYWSGHVSMGNGRYENGAGSINGEDSAGMVLRDPDNLMNSSAYTFVMQRLAPWNNWCDVEHSSWLNSLTNPNAPILDSRYSLTPACQFAWADEITASAVDGSNTVWRFAHNFNSGSQCYYAQAFAQISNDGAWALFSSPWSGTLGPDTSFGCTTRLDTFIVDLRNATSPPPKTQASQSITFARLSNAAVGAAPVPIVATASSGLAVSFSSPSAAVCSISGTAVVIVAPGKCSITASQAGNANYLVAPPVTQSFTVTAAGPTTPASQSITFAQLSNVAAGAAPVPIVATASSGLAVSFSSPSAAVCSISGTVAVIVAPGTCSITASQPGNANYLVAAPVTQSFTVTAASQSITFAQLSNVAVGAAPVPIVATASSGLAVSFSSPSAAVCSISGTFAVIVHPGTCSITASQAGNPSYAVAAPVSQSFTVTAAGPTTPASQSITFAQLSNVAAGAAPVQIVATASSGLAVSFSSLSAAVCSISGTFAVIVHPGTCSITASQAGNPSYAAAAPVTQSLTVTAVADAAPAIAPGGIAPIFSSSTTIQPGSWVSVYGTNLAGTTEQWNGDFPTVLGGVTVTIDGKPAYLSYVSPTQINLQAPDDSTTKTVSVTVTNAAGSVTSSVTLGQFGPSFLLIDGTHVAAIILRSDGSGTLGGGTYDIVGPTGTSLGYPTVAAKPGDTVEIFGVGFGPTSPVVRAGQVFSGAAAATNPVQLTIAGTALNPLFAGLSEAGLYQINVTIPTGLGSGDQPLAGIAGGNRTQTGVVISLQ